jgi:mannitol-1-phosphate/altronate dehydrogenase
MVNTKQIVIFGAGKIGRSFIGQLFGCSGYQVVFIDVDPAIRHYTTISITINYTIDNDNVKYFAQDT